MFYKLTRKTCGQNTTNGRKGVFQSIGRKRRTIDAVIGKVIRLFINVDRRFDCIYEAPVIEKINAAKPDVLFVCLGAPKQEIFMKTHLKELHVKLMIGLGGSLDSFAGTVKRAPNWMIRCNLEWLYRLIKEPKRFGRMLRLPKYLFAVLGKRIRG